MSLLQLESNDFHIGNIDSEKLAVLLKNKKLTLVFFYSKLHPLCINLFQIFKKCPSYIQGCDFAVVDVLNCRDLCDISVSKKAVNSLTAVPYILLYNNGFPVKEYKYTKDFSVENIASFINYCVDELKKFYSYQQSQQLQQQRNNNNSNMNQIGGGNNQQNNQQQRNNNDNTEIIKSKVTGKSRSRKRDPTTMGLMVCNGDICYYTTDNAYKKSNN